MKKYSIIFFFIFTILFTGGLLKISAAETTTPTQINARILPLIWYSTLSINDGDSIKIYAGIQNNSDLDFTGQFEKFNKMSGTFQTTDEGYSMSGTWVAIR